MQSKARLTHSMYLLLQEMPFEKITTQMIIDRAGVSKATFYRDFHDKYELMNWCYQEYVDRLLQKLDSCSWGVVNKEILKFIYDNQNYYTRAIQVDGQNSFLDFLYRYSLDFCKREYLKRKQIRFLNKEEQIILEFYSAGSIYTVKKWIERGFQLSVEEIAELLFALMPDIMKPLF